MTEAFVLDVSATLPWCFEDEATAGSVALPDRLEDAVAVVPALWHVELTNALLQGELRKRIDPVAGMEFLALIDGLRIEPTIGSITACWVRCSRWHAVIG